MLQDSKNQRTIFDPDVSCSGKSLKENQPKDFSYQFPILRDIVESIKKTDFDYGRWITGRNT